MNKFAYIISAAAMTVTAVIASAGPARAGETFASAKSSIEVGQMLFTADGKRLGTVYKVKDDGSLQVILEGKLVSIPASTISVESGKLSTSLKKSEVKKR